MFERFTDRTHAVLGLARAEAEHHGHEYIGTEHLLLGLMGEGEGVAAKVLAALDVTMPQLRAEVGKLVTKKPPSGAAGKQLPLTPQAKKALEQAMIESRQLAHEYVGTEHLLLGLARDPETVAARALTALGLKPERVRRKLLEFLAGRKPFANTEKRVPAPLDPAAAPAFGAPPTTDPGRRAAPGAPAAPAPGRSGLPSRRGGSNPLLEMPDVPARGDDPEPASRRGAPALERFGKNLGQQAGAGDLPPFAPRPVLLERALGILCARWRNQVALIGEPGTGKASLVAGLARALASGTSVPPRLADRHVIWLDLPLLVAGSKDRGHFEERLQTIAAEVRRAGRPILWITGSRTLRRAGAWPGALSAGEVLAPALVAGEIQCILTDTPAHFRELQDDDPALARVFEPVRLEPADHATTLEILRAHRPELQRHYESTIDDDALVAALELSEHYLPERAWPGGAVDLLDHACAFACQRHQVLPLPLAELSARLRELDLQKEEAVREQDFARAASLRDESLASAQELDRLLAQHRGLTITRARVESYAREVLGPSGMPG